MVSYGQFVNQEVIKIKGIGELNIQLYMIFILCYIFLYYFELYIYNFRVCEEVYYYNFYIMMDYLVSLKYMFRILENQNIEEKL